MATTYTADEIDQLLAKQMSDIDKKLDKVIVMASSDHEPNPIETSLYMQVVAEDKKG